MDFVSPAIGRGGAYVGTDTIRPEKWYSVKEISDYAGVSEDTIRRQIREGFLKAFRLPSKSSPFRRRVYKVFRILGAEVLRWMREHTS